MKFIPDRLKNIFRRKSRKAEKPAPAAVVEPVVAPPAPVEAPKPSRVGRLDRFRQPEGYYLLDLSLGLPGSAQGGMPMHVIKNEMVNFYLAIFAPSPLAACKVIASEAEEVMLRKFDLDVAKVYFKRKDADYYFDGYDERLGLPPGNEFQMVLVPEGCNWRPDYCPRPQKAIPGTGTILEHPATLMPQYAPRQPFRTLIVNGYEVGAPVLPQIPRAVEEKQPEQKNEMVATPAASFAPPQPPKP